MRAKFNAVSWLVLATALSGAAPASAQQAPLSGPVAESAKKDIVTVYGDRQQNEPGAFSVISEQTIQDTAANHPAEILNTVPGVNVQMNSGQELLIAIRSPVLPAGAGQGSFLILENGVPIRAPAFGNVNALFELHHETAEDIEVVRGPASVRYGSNAVHGLINIIDPVPGMNPGWKVDMSGNTLQRFRADAVDNIATTDGGYLAALSVMGDHGWRDSSSVDQQKLTLRALQSGADWKVTTTLNAVNLNQETAGFITGLDAYKNKDTAKTNPNPEAYRDAWVARIDSRIEKSFGDNLLTVTPFAITQRMIFIQHFLPDQSTEKNGQDSGGIMARYDFGPSAMRWSVGADVQYADGKLKEIQSRASFGAGAPANPLFPKGIHYDYDVATWMLAAYGELNWEFADSWRLLGGVRVENHNYDYTTNKAPGVYGRFRIAPSRKDEYNLVTPKLGVIYSGFDWGSIYANYARGERAPQASDQYRLQNFQTIEKLKVETLDSLEVGARGTVAGITYDVAAYTMKKEHFFFRDADGLNVPDGKTDHAGIEAALSGQLGEFAGGRLEWSGNVSWSDQTYAFNRSVLTSLTEVIVDGNQIDTAPEWLADAGLGWRSEKFYIGLSAEYVGEYFEDAANLHQYPGHLIAHLRGSWNFSDHLQAYGIIRNVTDERYADRADFASNTDRYFPGEPVNLTLGVRVRG